MSEIEIIEQAKHYFGKTRSFKKDLVLTYELNGKNYKQWKKEINQITSNPNEIGFGLFDDVIISIVNSQQGQIDWKWIGDLSWTIEILFNKDVEKGYDWDKKLATNCNGTARILKLYVSDVIPCYTYDCYFMTYSKKDNYYEFGPIQNFTNDEKILLKKVKVLLRSKGFQYVNKKFSARKFKELYSDTNSDGNASLFDVLFSDTAFYTTEIQRFCDKDIIEKNGMKFRWTESYYRNGKLKERTESRWTNSGDYFRIVLDNKGQIKKAEVTRNKIGGKMHQRFELDIIETYKRQIKTTENSKKTNSSSK